MQVSSNEMQLPIYLLITCILTTNVASDRHDYSEQAWVNAADYLQQAMDWEAKPCDNFFGHVCGNYGANNNTAFESSFEGKGSAVALILSEAIDRIHLNDTELPEYERAIKVFHDKCTSVELDAAWPKTLYEAMVKRLGELPLFEMVRRGGAKGGNSNSTTTPAASSTNGTRTPALSTNGTTAHGGNSTLSATTLRATTAASTGKTTTVATASSSSSSAGSNSTTPTLRRRDNSSSITPGPSSLAHVLSAHPSKHFDTPSATVDPWFLLGRVQRIGEPVFLMSSVDFVEDGCRSKPELQLQPLILPLDFDASSMNHTELREKVRGLAAAIGMNKSSLDPYLDVWLNQTMEVYEEWMNLSMLAFAGEGDRIALANLSRELPDFNWKEYFRGLLPDEAREHLESDQSNTIFVANKEFVASLGKSMKKYGTDTIKSLLFLRAFYSIQANYFGDFSRVASAQLLAEVKTANDRCLEFALRFLAPAMARLYFKAIDVDILRWRHEIQMLGRNIFSAFRFLLNSVDWLDVEDKQKIEDKIDSITFNPGIPSWIMDEEKIMERIVVYNTSMDPFENELLGAENFVDRTVGLGLMEDMEEYEADEADLEPDPSFEVNAEYDPSTKQINMFLGLMVPPLFNITYPLPVKYGGLGVVIGHELMHAFDAEGIYAGVSEDHEWLKEEAFKEFEKKKNCLVHQYSRYCDRTKGLCVDGERTIGENIADIDGIKVAYTAFKVLTQVVGDDPPIPGLVEYTDDQIFFMSFARTWCSKGVMSAEELMDVHTPSKPRVEVAIRNVPMFGRAFQCAMGSKYVPMSRGCSLWGDLEDPAARYRRQTNMTG